MNFIAASNLAVIGTLPGANCHELSGNRNGQLAVKITANDRMIFKPDHDPLPIKEDGGLDWNNVTALKL